MLKPLQLPLTVVFGDNDDTCRVIRIKKSGENTTQLYIEGEAQPVTVKRKTGELVEAFKKALNAGEEINLPLPQVAKSRKRSLG